MCSALAESLLLAGLAFATSACSAAHNVSKAGPASDAGAIDAWIRPDAGTLADAQVADVPVADAPLADVTVADGPAADAAAPDAGDDAGADAGSYVWNLPPGFPIPVVPAENPMSAEKVDLGRHLFYDKALSHNWTKSCASCHQQALAFTDGLARAVGSTGAQTPRSAMSLANVAYASTLTWANPLELDLEHQALIPMFGDDPIELGLQSQDELVERLGGVDAYTPLFAAAWPGDPAPLTFDHVVDALASFERTIISGRSPFDRYLHGDQSALSASALRGYSLFNGEQLDCFHCHVGFDLTDHVNWQGKAFFDHAYHNTGLYNIDGKGAYPEPNTGVYHVTGVPSDMGKFKAPTLRNIAITAPYFHDGSAATLDDALDNYQAGGRNITSGPYAGDGNLSPLKDPLIRPLQMSAQDRADVKAFLQSLTDDAFLHDPALSNPW
jgi:cytochrome c peroxidase